MRVTNPDNFTLKGFRKSQTAGKKYDAILEQKKTKRIRHVPFGDIKSSHFRDVTPLKLYSHLNHNNKERRESFRARHGENAKYKYSSAWFSTRYLWP